MGRLKELVEKRFGFPTRHIEYSYSISTTPTKVLNNNPDRLMYVLSNLGANVVYLGFTSEVSSTNGIYIDANGGALTLLAEEDGELVGQEAWVIGAGSTNIYIVAVEAGA